MFAVWILSIVRTRHIVNPKTMSSIPLSRILQTKKTNGDAEKEQFDKQMVNIQNALFSLNKCYFNRIIVYSQNDSTCWSPVVDRIHFKSKKKKKRTAILRCSFLSVAKKETVTSFTPCWSFIASQLRSELSTYFRHFFGSAIPMFVLSVFFTWANRLYVYAGV